MHHAKPNLHFTELPYKSYGDQCANAHTLLRIQDFRICFRYILWSAREETFITIQDCQQNINLS